MNPTIAKYATKTVLSAGVSLVIGIMIKAQREAEDRIDEHYSNKDKD